MHLIADHPRLFHYIVLIATASIVGVVFGRANRDAGKQHPFGWKFSVGIGAAIFIGDMLADGIIRIASR